MCTRLNKERILHGQAKPLCYHPSCDCLESCPGWLTFRLHWHLPEKMKPRDADEEVMLALDGDLDGDDKAWEDAEESEEEECFEGRGRTRGL